MSAANKTPESADSTARHSLRAAPGSGLDALPPIALDVFWSRMGITRSTVWTWRRKGMITTINICGKLYITAKEIVEFNRRAEAGEFAEANHCPPRGPNHVLG